MSDDNQDNGSQMLALPLGGFPARLFRIRSNKGMSQSDLARLIWGEVKNKLGYPEAKNRDRISAWEAGRAIPTSANLSKLAEALEVSIADLDPDAALRSPHANTTKTPFSMVQMPNGKTHLKIDVEVPFDIAVQIAKLLA
jgi:transcriptional regulator with XRE-family HTH domain